MTTFLENKFPTAALIGEFDVRFQNPIHKPKFWKNVAFMEINNIK